MSKGAWAATAADSILLAADGSRQSIEIQFFSGDAVFLGFGEAGTVDEGIKLFSDAPYYRIPPGDYRASLAIHGICDGAGTAAGGYVTS